MPTAVPLQQKLVPLTAMRRTIAKRLSESTGPIPHFYLTVDCDVTDLLAMREQLNTITGAKVSVNDFVIRAVALAIHHHPNVNASFGEEAITLHGAVHVGVAVATDDGLITPIVRNADEKSVADISASRVMSHAAPQHSARASESSIVSMLVVSVSSERWSSRILA